jgi:glycosyltransferase involved in cell wall biosynthesis
MSFSIIVPSRNISNLTACVKALREAGETSRVIWVDDYDSPHVLPPHVLGWACKHVNGERPFCFSRNVNIGIRAAGDDDVVILNDDALLERPEFGEGFQVMETITREHPDIGILGATTNVTGYPAQWRLSQFIEVNVMAREVKTLAFVCVYIPRRTLNTVGLLDERFTSYGGEDVDYCIRVREAGLKCGVTDYCFVDHSQLPSTFRAAHPQNRAPGDIAEGVRMLREKWGDKCPRFPRV